MGIEPERTSVSQPADPKPPDPDTPVEFEHPRGTMAIVMIFGLLFGVGWLAMYVFRFMATGAPSH